MDVIFMIVWGAFCFALGWGASVMIDELLIMLHNRKVVDEAMVHSTVQHSYLDTPAHEMPRIRKPLMKADVL